LVRIDLIERARRNQGNPVEAYLDEFPVLTGQREWVLDLLDAEICCAESCGKTPGIEDYLRRFPGYADEIRVMFEIQDWERASSESVFPSDAPKADVSAGGETAETDFDDTWRASRRRSTSDYRLGEVLGRGASGIVCKAHDLLLDRVVALKRLRTGDTATERDRLRFRTEAQAAARLSHPNIVKILDFGDLDGEPFLAMEYIEGRSLKERLADGPLPVTEAVRLGQEIAEALHYAHRHRVLHRDIKPGNILIDTDGRPLISDFGLAKRQGDTTSLTGTGDVLGTPGYMSPEQALGERGQVTVRSDVYGLGGLLYAMVTGRPPITGCDIADTLRRVVLDDPVPPRQWNPGVDRDLETIILKCLDKSPGKRYGSAEELAEELGRHRRGEPITARPLRRDQRVWRWCKRRPWPATAIFSPVWRFCW
jgi:eukaryotic-like serine/threonine-protein kinase